MRIKWNEVTWYSKLIAVVLFVLTFFGGFFLGKQSEQIVKNVALSIPAPVPINTVSYTCDAGKVIIAKYYQGESKPPTSSNMPPTPGGSVALALGDGRDLTLPQTISADGGRYANSDESFVFWSKGNTAFISENNENNMTYKNCVVTSQITKP